jgi:hypothetical protein
MFSTSVPLANNLMVLLFVCRLQDDSQDEGVKAKNRFHLKSLHRVKRGRTFMQNPRERKGHDEIFYGAGQRMACTPQAVELSS